MTPLGKELITLSWKLTTGQILAPQGYQAAAVAAGIKRTDGRVDVGLIHSSHVSIGAAKFTTNVVKAAPVLLCQENLKRAGGEIRAIIVNSGNANACTGPEGMAAARRMARLAAGVCSVAEEQTLVSSTGVIGMAFPVERMESHAEELRSRLRPEGLADVAQAIMTTDTVRKVCTAEGNLGGVPVRISGMTKGSGMIHPNMATTLAFVLTDVFITRDLLEEALGIACEKSYNRISVDGDTSTNDTLALLANGASGAALIDKRDDRFHYFVEGVTQVCCSLAKQIVRDGEGARKFIEILVKGVPSETEATRIARSIANSPLVKTAMAGEDANWGRILCAAGYSGVQFDPSRVSISIGDLEVCRQGGGLRFDEARAKAILSNRDIQITLDLGGGQASSTMWTCDLTEKYIEINADYRT